MNKDFVYKNTIKFSNYVRNITYSNTGLPMLVFQWKCFKRNIAILCILNKLCSQNIESVISDVNKVQYFSEILSVNELMKTVFGRFLILHSLSKSLKSFHVLVSKSLLDMVTKIKFSSPKDPLAIENQSRIHFIPCSCCNLGYNGQTRRQLNTKLDEHRSKVKNEDI